MGKTQKIGQHAEQAACDYLTRHGLRLVERNYHCRYGEIDLIMQEQDTLVFIEVRARKKHNPVDALTSVDYFKQQKLMRSAEYYLQQHRVSQLRPARFDVIAIMHSQDKPFQIDWIKNAIEG